MKLATWREREGIRPAQLAQLIACDRKTATRYELPSDHPDHRLPDRRRMVAIFVVTAGQVTPNDFYDLPDLPATGADDPVAALRAVGL